MSITREPGSVSIWFRNTLKFSHTHTHTHTAFCFSTFHQLNITDHYRRARFFNSFCGIIIAYSCIDLFANFIAHVPLRSHKILWGIASMFWIVTLQKINGRIGGDVSLEPVRRCITSGPDTTRQERTTHSHFCNSC